MATRGRKPLPAALKILKGTRPDRIPQDAPSPPAGRPDRPAHLDEDAIAEWDRIVPELDVLGVLARVDGCALGLYCQAHSLLLKANRSIDDFGLLIQTGMGSWKTNPAVAIAAQARSQMHRLLVEFGMTPSSRGRVKTSSGEQRKDPLGDFLARRPR